MPRVQLYKQKYMVEDFSNWIIGRMRIMKKSQAYMGELLGISQAGFGQKVRQANFKYSEMLTVLKELQATDEEILKFMRL